MTTKNMPRIIADAYKSAVSKQREAEQGKLASIVGSGVRTVERRKPDLTAQEKVQIELALELRALELTQKAIENRRQNGVNEYNEELDRVSYELLELRNKIRKM